MTQIVRLPDAAGLMANTRQRERIVEQRLQNFTPPAAAPTGGSYVIGCANVVPYSGTPSAGAQALTGAYDHIDLDGAGWPSPDPPVFKFTLAAPATVQFSALFRSYFSGIVPGLATTPSFFQVWTAWPVTIYPGDLSVNPYPADGDFWYDYTGSWNETELFANQIACSQYTQDMNTAAHGVMSMDAGDYTLFFGNGPGGRVLGLNNTLVNKGVIDTQFSLSFVVGPPTGFDTMLTHF